MMGLDEDLYREFLSGSVESYDHLVKRNRNFLIWKLSQMIDDPFICEDISQDVFVDIYMYKERYNFRCSVKTYLAMLAHYKSLDFIRRNKLHVNIDDAVDLISDESVEEDIFGHMEAEQVREAVKMLKDEYREVIYWIEYRKKSYTKTAAIMQKNVGQVRMLIHRAKQKLKFILESEVEEDEK